MHYNVRYFSESTSRGLQEVYQEKVIKAGLSAIGNSRCDPLTMANGKMATKSVMCHEYGMKGAVARMIMPAMETKEKVIDTQNCFSTLGTSIKKLENSASLEVAPHVMSTSNM